MTLGAWIPVVFVCLTTADPKLGYAAPDEVPIRTHALAESMLDTCDSTASTAVDRYSLSLRPAGIPSWLKIDGEQRTRFEHLDRQLRAGRRGSDHGLFTRSRLRVSIDADPLIAAVELIDSRQFLESADSPRCTAQVNAIEPIQLFAGLRFDDAFITVDSLLVQAGRFTLDLGSRRLVARNRFRNTVNTFAVVNIEWTSDSGDGVRAFWTMPVQGLPDDPSGIRNNRVAINELSLDRQLWGVVGAVEKKLFGAGLEIGLLGVHERIGRHRELLTPDLWVRSAPHAGEWDYELESALQFGRSRLTHDQDLDHAAFFQHAEIGYTVNGPTRFRSR